MSPVDTAALTTVATLVFGAALAVALAIVALGIAVAVDLLLHEWKRR